MPKKNIILNLPGFTVQKMSGYDPIVFEDDCPIYRGHAAENLCIMRKMVLQLLERETSSSQGIALKRQKAGLSTRYLRKVVGF